MGLIVGYMPLSELGLLNDLSEYAGQKNGYYFDGAIGASEHSVIIKLFLLKERNIEAQAHVGAE